MIRLEPFREPGSVPAKPLCSLGSLSGHRVAAGLAVGRPPATVRMAAAPDWQTVGDSRPPNAHATFETSCARVGGAAQACDRRRRGRGSEVQAKKGAPRRATIDRGRGLKYHRSSTQPASTAGRDRRQPPRHHPTRAALDRVPPVQGRTGRPRRRPDRSSPTAATTTRNTAAACANAASPAVSPAARPGTAPDSAAGAGWSSAASPGSTNSAASTSATNAAATSTKPSSPSPAA